MPHVGDSSRVRKTIQRERGEVFFLPRGARRDDDDDDDDDGERKKEEKTVGDVFRRLFRKIVDDIAGNRNRELPERTSVDGSQKRVVKVVVVWKRVRGGERSSGGERSRLLVASKMRARVRHELCSDSGRVDSCDDTSFTHRERVCFVRTIDW